jgi:hypothetical protein
VMRLPLTYKDLDIYSQEYNLTGFYGFNFLAHGTYGGGLPETFSVELLNYIYIGLSLPDYVKAFSKCNIGLQFQRQFYMNNQFNYFSGSYNDWFGDIRSEERFIGSHTSLSLVLGITL